MSDDHIIPLNIPPVMGLKLAVDLKRYKLLQNGEPLKAKWGRYKVPDLLQEEVIITIKPPGVFNYTPQAVINGVKHNLLPPFSRLQTLWISAPMIVLFCASIFTAQLSNTVYVNFVLFLNIILCTMLNIKIFRSKLHTAMRYSLASSVTFAGLLAYIAALFYIGVSTGKIDYEAVKERSNKKIASIIVSGMVDQINKKAASAVQDPASPSIIEGAVAEGSTMVYLIKIKDGIDTSSVYSDDFRRQITEGMSKEFCHLNSTETLKERKIKIEQRIRDAQGKNLISFTLDTTTCPPAAQ